jgi:hypothetical protein
MTRRSPNRRAGGPSSRREGGTRDPLKGWTRKDKDTTLTDPFMVQQPVVDVTASGLQLVEVGQPPAAAQVSGVVDDGLDAKRSPLAG